MTLLRFLDPRRYARRTRQLLAEARYDLAAIRTEENAKFAAAGLDPVAGRARLDAALAALGAEPFDHTQRDDSVHWLLFSCLSLTAWGREVRDVLEIGTFRGKTTALLKELYPQAAIVTCDLPPDDPILARTYGRDDPAIRADHEGRRARNLARAGARFVQANSLFLPARAPGPYDLLWIDGGHLYPEVAWDTCNAWHMCRPGGRILFDDVFTHPKGGDGAYGNRDAYGALTYLVERSRTDITLFLKRENPTWSARVRDRKFVALLVKPEDVV